MKTYVITFTSGNKVEVEADNIRINEGIVILSIKDGVVCAFSFSILESFLCKK